MPGRRFLALVVAAALAVSAVLASSGSASASMGAPAWSSGDFWTWTWTSGGVTFVRTWSVGEWTSVEVGGHGYGAWRVNETTTRTTTSGSAVGWTDLWIRTSDLGLVKEVMGGGAQTYLWDPPLSNAVFPLGGNSWSLSTTQTSITPLGTSSGTVQYSGTALPETNVSNAKGAFTAVPVRSPSIGATYQVAYYAEAIGNWIEIRTYVLGVLTSTQVLTDFRYQSPGWAVFLWLIGGFVGLGLASVAALLWLRRKRRSWPRYPRPPAGPPAPPVPPPKT